MQSRLSKAERAEILKMRKKALEERIRQIDEAIKVAEQEPVTAS